MRGIAPECETCAARVQHAAGAYAGKESSPKESSAAGCSTPCAWPRHGVHHLGVQLASLTPPPCHSFKLTPRCILTHRVSPCARAHTHMHALAQAHTHIHALAQAHTHMHALAQVHTHALAHARTRTHTRTHHIHMHTHAHTHARRAACACRHQRCLARDGQRGPWHNIKDQ